MRQGVHAHVGGFAKAIAAGLGLRHNWGSQYRARAFQADIKWLGIRSTPAYVGEPECKDDITEHAKIETLGKSTVELFRGLPLRHTPAEGPGFEAVSLVVVDFDNLRKNPDLPYGAPRPEDPKLVTGTPAPQTGDPMHYATMIRRICDAFEDRWQRSTR